MVFKKQLTPIGGGKGRINMQRGKGSTVQRNTPGQQETLTGGNPLARMLNRYPAQPQPAPNAMAPPTAPAATVGPQPTAAMPPAMPPIGPPDQG
jgi:hypothetical protein